MLQTLVNSSILVFHALYESASTVNITLPSSVNHDLKFACLFNAEEEELFCQDLFVCANLLCSIRVVEINVCFAIFSTLKVRAKFHL